ncbi:MAG: hypothetical protein AABW51_03115 [Nanoarchaeota archaeon]
MISEKEKERLRETIKFWNEVSKPIEQKRFNEAKQELEKYADFFEKNPKDRDYYFQILRHLRWIRDELESTQRDKKEFELDAKEVITEINKLLLTLAKVIGKANFDEKTRNVLFEEINKLFGPIFMTISEPKEGFASFQKIEPDTDYYQKTHSRLIREIYTKDDLIPFKIWKEKYNQELTKKWGLSRDGK